MKKKLLILGSTIMVLLGGAAVGGHAWLKARLQKESIITQMEEAWNCRAHLDKTTVSFFSSPAKVELIGLKLAPRDVEVGKPLAARTAFNAGAALLSVDRAILSVELSDLINGRLAIKQLHVENVIVKTEVDEEGESSLQTMFDSPDDVETAAARMLKTHHDIDMTPRLAHHDFQLIKAEGGKAEDESADQPTKKKKKKKKDDDKKKEKKPFKAGDLHVTLMADEASVENADISISNLANHTLINFQKVRFSLTAIDVQAGDLANHDRCDLEYEGLLRVENTAEKTQMANFMVSGKGVLSPFAKDTGEWNPDVSVEATIKKGGLLGGLPMDQQMKEKDLGKLKEYGIDLGTIAVGGVLGEDASTDVHAFNGKMLVKKDTRLVFPQYEITLSNGSSISAGEDAINARGTLVVGAELSKTILDQAKQSTAAKFGPDLAEFGLKILSSTLMDEKQQLVLPFKAKGKLSKPEVQLDMKLAAIKDGIQDVGKSLLEGLLKGK